jgi:hypothetical protein
MIAQMTEGTGNLFNHRLPLLFTHLSTQSLVRVYFHEITNQLTYNEPEKESFRRQEYNAFDFLFLLMTPVKDSVLLLHPNLCCLSHMLFSITRQT